MKKVLHVLSSNRFSGAENVVCQIIDMFKNNEAYEMIYCSPNGQIQEALDERNIKYVPIPKLSVKELKKVLDYYNPDIIHAHDVRAGVISSFFSSRYRVISHMHVNNDDMKKFNLKTIIYYMASYRFSHIFWVSKSSLNQYYFNRNVKHKSSVLYNVIDVSSTLLKSSKDKSQYNYDICYIGRLTHQKNPQRLVKILYEVVKQKANVKCAIVGDGVLKEEVRDMVRSLGIEENIQILGFKNNPLKIIKDSKIMVMTSRFEGTPICALEAMALGTPIISTPTDGMIDIIKHEVTGYLSNDDTELRDNIIQLLNDDEKRLNMSKESYSHSIDLNCIDTYRDSISLKYIN